MDVAEDGYLHERWRAAVATARTPGVRVRTIVGADGAARTLGQPVAAGSSHRGRAGGRRGRRGRRARARPGRRRARSGRRSRPATTSTPRRSSGPSDFRGGQRDLFLVGLAIELAALGAARPRPPAVAPRRLLERLGARPILGAAAAGAGISLLLALLALPTGLIAHERAVDVGLSTQDLGGWLGDRARAAGDRGRPGGARRADPGRPPAPAAARLVGRRRRRSSSPTRSSAPGSPRSSSRRSSTTSSRCPRGRPGQRRARARRPRRGRHRRGLRRRRLAAQHRASTPTSTGSARAKRVVLYDNLLDEPTGRCCGRWSPTSSATSPTTTSPRGLLFVAIVAPLGMLARRARRRRRSRAAAGPRPARRRRCPPTRSLIAVVAFGARPGRQPALARRSRRAPTASRWS